MRLFIFALVFLGCTVFPWAHGITESQQQAMVVGGNLSYLWLGAVHMVTGYDHLLFLFGVIFYLSGMKDIFKFVTAFTIGHSITLILATFMKITANYYLVDAVIALSVCYKAFDNLDGFRKYFKVNPPHLLAMILVFGLIHGFGLSTRLQQLPLPGEGLLTRILSFNVGVELGQVAALSVLVLLLAGWRRTSSFKKLGGIANIILLLAGIGLFIYQVNGFLRGGEHHEEDSHGPSEHGKIHESHENNGDHEPHESEGTNAVHKHDGSAHEHGEAQIDLTRPVEGADSNSVGTDAPNAKPVEKHSHEDGVPHSH